MMGNHAEAISQMEPIAGSTEADATMLKELATWLAMTGDTVRAQAMFERVLAMDPYEVDCWIGAGNTALISGDSSRALVCYERALGLRPRDTGVMRNAATALRGLGRAEDVVTWLERAVDERPDDASLLTDLGDAYRQAGDPRGAERAFRKALMHNAECLRAINNLGLLLYDELRLEEAEALLAPVVGLPGAPPDVAANLANVRLLQNRLDEALTLSNRAFAEGYNRPEGRFSRSMILLSMQRYEEGWPLYESRFEIAQLASCIRAGTPWRGEPLSDRTILLWAEQGVGDTFQFVRYVALIEKLGARVCLEVQEAARRVVAASFPGADVRPQGATWDDRKIDFNCALLSLPFRLGTTFSTVPWNGPYLTCMTPSVGDAVKAVPLRVGLVWAGNPLNPTDRNRSMRWDDLSPLTDVHGVTFYPLQLGSAGAQCRRSDGPWWQDRRATLRDFDDTGALMRTLDIIVTVDTAVAHLAGAMGLETWVLLSHSPDWRWLPPASTTPWYPTHRLFRCSTPGRWDDPVLEIAEMLAGRRL